MLGAERFVVEIKTTAALQHPHILPLFDSGTADGFLFYVMPYIEGETLRDKLNRETQLGVDEAVRIAREVADALDYAHRHGVIHRDIKPENILLHDGRAMVVDFGIALAVQRAAGGRMTETGLSLGTPHYMSPGAGDGGEGDHRRGPTSTRSASVLYEMLAGRAAAHRRLGAADHHEDHRRAGAAGDAAAQVGAAERGGALVAKALEKLPADRFESAKAFADALANATFATTASARPALAAASAHGGVWRGAFVVTAAVAPLATAGFVWALRRPTVVPDEPVVRVVVDLQPGERLPSGTLGSVVAISLQGDRGGQEALWAGSGNTIFYRTPTGGVESAAVTRGATITVGDRRLALPPADYLDDITHASYDVWPDGSGFLMVKPVVGDDRPILVHNWGRTLREKLAAGSASK